jgi:cell fate (sporulation/competence/biofilm development) regulator YlbF (YheA/YmcA/DUF963 family)
MTFPMEAEMLTQKEELATLQMQQTEIVEQRIQQIRAVKQTIRESEEFLKFLERDFEAQRMKLTRIVSGWLRTEDFEPIEESERWPN